MNKYFAIFRPTQNCIEVEFPDLAGCVTFGKNWDEAIDNAVDVLAGWLANADTKFIKKPSTYDKLSKRIKHDERLVPIMVDEKCLEKYQELKRFNVIFPVHTLKIVDRYRKQLGLKRSKIIQMAVEEYINNHPV